MNPTKPNFDFDVFLSHHSGDKTRVRKLANKLKEHGLKIWFDEWLIQPGDDIYLSIEKGLEASRIQILCLSTTALTSEWVKLERSTVLFRDPSNLGRRFIPLLLEDCQLPDVLRRYKYLDYRQESQQVFSELLKACQSEEPIQPKASQNSDATLSKTVSEGKILAPALVTFERRLRGHKLWVNDIAVSPDGNWLASASDDKSIKIWDLATGKCLATLQGHQDRVACIAISSDGQQIFSGAKDDTICVWSVANQKLITSWNASHHFVLSLSLLSNNQQLLTAGTGTALNLWDITTQKCLRTFQGHDGVINAVTVSKDKGLAISASSDQTLKLWELKTGKCLATLKGHSDTVRAVQLTADGTYALSSSRDQTIKIWDLDTASCIGTLEGHKHDIYSIALSPNEQLLASTGFTDFTIRLWDWKTGNCLQIIKNKDEAIPLSVTFSPDGSRLVVGTTDDGIYIYQLNQTVSSVQETVHKSAQENTPITLRYINAKVVLVGESGVGKSGLAHCLINNTFVATDSTHGMAVWRLDLPPVPAANQSTAIGKDMDREALLWDLAGQEDYRLIHQLFLDETAMALMCFNPQQSDPFAEINTWLKVLDNALSKQSKHQMIKLLIAARIDVGGVKVSQTKIDDFIRQKGFAAYLPTSAKRGDACCDKENQSSELKQLIAQNIPWDTLPWTSTPQLLLTLKNEIIKMTEQENIRLVRFAELSQQLKQTLTTEQFTTSDVRTAITLLANHGLVLALEFGDLILLRPELLNGYAAAIIRAAREHTDEIGCVAEYDVLNREIDLSDIQRLDHCDEELLMPALIQTFLNKSLCIAENTDHGRHLIFPSQYRREREIPQHPEIYVSYSFTGEWQTIYTTLVVRLWYSEGFETHELWCNAAEFKTIRGHIAGLLMSNTNEGQGRICLFFDTGVVDELKINLIKYVHQHLQKYASEVKRNRHYICQCGEPIDNFKAVEKRLAANKTFIYCQHCDAKVELIDFIEQQLKSDKVAQEVLKMEQTASQQLDNQALEQILIGHLMSICGEANQIFRPTSLFDYGIDGEVEFKDDIGQASGKKIYVQLKNGGSYLRQRKTDNSEIFTVKNERHLNYWINQPVDVYLVIRDEKAVIRWMNVTQYLKNRTDKNSKQIIFQGEKLDFKTIWELRDQFF